MLLHVDEPFSHRAEPALHCWPLRWLGLHRRVGPCLVEVCRFEVRWGPGAEQRSWIRWRIRF